MPRTPKDVSAQIEAKWLADMQIIPAETFGSMLGLNADSERVMQSRGTLPPCIKIANRRYYREDAAMEYIKRATIEIDNTHRAAERKAKEASQDLLK